MTGAGSPSSRQRTSPATPTISVTPDSYPVLAPHRLADDDGPTRLGIAQEPAGDERDPQHLEVMRRDDQPLDVAGEVVALERPPAGNAEEHVLPGPERKRAGQSCRFHAGNSLGARDELPAETVYRARLPIGRARQGYFHGEQVARVEAQIHGMHGREAADQQRGAA
jgi:hypothetical protein